MTTHAISVEPADEHDADDADRPNDPTIGAAPSRRSAHGPTAGLVALPDLDEVEPNAQVRVLAYLLQAEAARRRQLDTLPTIDRDLVAAAYRATVERILGEVVAARRRAEAGLYGICSACSAVISPERLEHLLWPTECARCATGCRRDGHGA